VRGTPQTESEQRTRRLSDELIAELRAADTIIIGAPMCNFGVPTGLRAWFDHVLRAGETFSYTEAGPQGLLAGKRAIVIESRGGLYSEGPQSDRLPGALSTATAPLHRCDRRDLHPR
jgi:FMN-dependent NADH-azoreductase